MNSSLQPQRGSVMFHAPMRRFVLLAFLPLAAFAEMNARVAAVVNGGANTLSDVEGRVAPELARVPAGPAGVPQRKELLRQALGQLIDEQLVQGGASAPGIGVSDDEVQRLVEQLARENR